MKGLKRRLMAFIGKFPDTNFDGRNALFNATFGGIV